MPAPQRDGPRWPRAEWLLPLGLALWFTCVGLRSTSSEHSWLAAVVMAVLYGGLATFLFLGARFAVRAGRAWGALGVLALGCAPAAQLNDSSASITAGIGFTAGK